MLSSLKSCNVFSLSLPPSRSPNMLSPFSTSFYLCLCVCGHVCTGFCVHGCKCIWKQEIDISSPLQFLSTYFFQSASLLNREFAESAGLAADKPQGSSYVHLLAVQIRVASAYTCWGLNSDLHVLNHCHSG